MSPAPDRDRTAPNRSSRGGSTGPATGVVQIPTSSAAVALRFTNRTNAALHVPKGTVVIADNGTRFTTGNDIDLPRLNTTADVVALAQVPGTVGNVPANSVRRIEGDIGFRAAVTNPAAGEKGTDTPQTVVAEADREGVRAFADAVLLDAAQQDLRQRFAETATLFPPVSLISTVRPALVFASNPSFEHFSNSRSYVSAATTSPMLPTRCPSGVNGRLTILLSDWTVRKS